MSPPSRRAVYELEIESLGGDDVLVHTFRGTEELSGGYDFRVELSTRDLAPNVEAWLGARARFSMHVGPGARTFSGLVASVQLLGPRQPSGRVHYAVRVIPRLWTLRFKRRSRIFQNMRVDEIVGAVLAEEMIPSRWQLLADNPSREYCTQYEESDYRFIRRLLAERAIVSYAEPAPDAVPLGDEILVFGDTPDVYGEIEALHYRGHAGFAADAFDEVSRLERFDRVRADAATYWEYDPLRPETILKATSRPVASVEAGARREAYEHHGAHLATDWNDGRTQPERILRRRRRDARTLGGDSTAPALAVGRRFTLEGHPLLSGAYVPVRIVHEGWGHSDAPQDTPYRNNFECVPADVLFPPRRPARRNVMATLTARVVGPAQEEIHTNERGQIRVQFHWDREGHRNENSSSWLRCMQSWAGEGWGAQFIPRVGMEVVVAFDGGDPNKPFVLGCLYNATHAPPFKLPEDKTRSGIRTQSTSSAQGFNELSFEDRAGAEQIYLHAQRDLSEKVGRDNTTVVDNDRSLTVGGSLSTRVSGSRLSETVGEVIDKTLGDSESDVGGVRTERVLKGRRLNVMAEDIVRITGRAVHSFGAELNLSVDGNYGIAVGSRGNLRNIDQFSWGDTMIGSGQAVTLSADRKITLRCGESALELGPDSISLRSPKLRIEAQKEAVMSSDGPALRLAKNAEITADNVRLYSTKAALELDDKAHLNGQEVLLNCGMEEPTDLESLAEKVLTQKLSLKLADPDFEPYAGKDFVVKAGGERVEGTTGADGSLSVDIPVAARSAEVLLWLGQRPTSETRRYMIELAELPPPDELAGVQARLKHLGYFHRAPTDELDEATRAALKEFQEDHELEPTGELDDATRSAVVDAHGH